jgi:hypothetical protein
MNQSFVIQYYKTITGLNKLLILTLFDCADNLAMTHCSSVRASQTGEDKLLKTPFR